MTPETVFAKQPPVLDEETPAFTKEEAIDLVREWVSDYSDDQMTQEEMIQRLMEIDPWRTAECGVPSSGLTKSEFAEIVRTYAPNAPHEQTIQATDMSSQDETKGGPAGNAERDSADLPKPIAANPYPPELRPLVESGAASYSEYTSGKPNHWMVKKCLACHNFNKDECCGQKTVPQMAESNGSLTRAGRQAAGLEPIDPVKTPAEKEAERIKSWEAMSWWPHFRGADELKGSGKVEFLIEGFLMKGGVTFFGGVSGNTISWLENVWSWAR